MTSTERRSPRVLITSTPGTGHVLPMVPLGRALQSAGCEVLWATGADAGRTVRSAGLAHAAAGIGLRERMERFHAEWPEAAGVPARDRRAVTFPALFAALAARPMYEDLARIAAELRPDLIVHEPCELAAAPLARRLGVPQVTVGLGRQIPRPLLVAAAPQLAPLWAHADVAVPDDCGLYADLYLHPLPEWLEAPRDGRAAPLRPLHDHDWAPLEPAPLERPSLYVTFGTEFGRAAPWRSVLDAIGNLGLTTLATTGGDVDAEELRPVPPCVRLEHWVPQREAMADADIVVSHGGSGALLGAVAAGKPHLAVPLGADHFENAALIASRHLGAQADPDRMTADSLAAAIADLAADRPVRASVRDAHDAMACMPSPRAVAERLRALATGDC